jgi:hypothetical protein
MPHEFQWNGAWRRLEREEYAGRVTSIGLGVSAANGAAPAPPPRASAVLSGALRSGAFVEVRPLERPDDVQAQPNGRVRMVRY